MFLSIEIELQDRFTNLLRTLDRLACFDIVESWHEFLLRRVKDVGLSMESAPAKSIISDRNESGIAYFVLFSLSTGQTLQGQLRKSGLLVSSQSVFTAELSGGELVNEKDLRNDESLIQILDCFREHANVIEIEVG